MTRLAARIEVDVAHVEHPIPKPFALDDLVRVSGLHGTFRVRGAGRDGSLTLFGGAAGRAGFRNIMPTRVRRVKR